MLLLAVSSLWSASWHQQAGGRTHAAAANRRSNAVSLQGPAPVTVFTSDVCIGHDPGFMHPEKPERLVTLLGALRSSWTDEFGALMRIAEPAIDVTDEQLLRVHTPGHVALLRDAFQKVASGGGNPFAGGRVKVDGDTLVSRGSEAASKRAAGLVVAAVDEVLSNASDASSRAFVMVRPPGHHAEADKPMGFCLYNNVMVGVAHAQTVHGVQKVAILDFDVHRTRALPSIPRRTRRRPQTVQPP